MCHHTRVFWRCRARLAFGVWSLRHSMELSPYLEFLSFNSTTTSPNKHFHTFPIYPLSHTQKKQLNLRTRRYVRQAHGYRARRRAPEPVRGRAHLCRASRKASWSIRRYAFSLQIHLYRAIANHQFLQTPQKAPQSILRPPTPARQTPKALHLQIRFDTDKVSKKAAWAVRRQVQQERRTLKVRQQKWKLDSGLTISRRIRRY